MVACYLPVSVFSPFGSNKTPPASRLTHILSSLCLLRPIISQGAPNIPAPSTGTLQLHTPPSTHTHTHHPSLSRSPISLPLSFALLQCNMATLSDASSKTTFHIQQSAFFVPSAPLLAFHTPHLSALSGPLLSVISLPPSLVSVFTALRLFPQPPLTP